MAGKTAELFELEMWLRSFERFFRIKNQPLSEKETRALALAQLVGGAAARRQRPAAGGPALHLDPDRGAGRPRPLRPLRRGLPEEGRGRRPLHREAGAPRRCPRPRLTLLREAFEDLHLLLLDLVKLSRMPYSTLHRGGEDRLPRDAAQPPAGPADRQEVQAHPRPHRQPRRGRPSSATSPSPVERSRPPRCSWSCSACCTTWSTRTPRTAGGGRLQEHDPDLLAHHLRDAPAPVLPRAARAAGHWTPTRPLYQLYDSFVYCLPLELKKVINTELIDISVTRQAGQRPGPRGEQPRHPQGLLPAVGGAAGPGLRRRGGRRPTSSRTSRPSSSSRWGCATAWPGWSARVREFQAAEGRPPAARA